ncbi:MAG: hypothetical protein U1A27_04890 [Phycisphaerae bacterium]
MAYLADIENALIERLRTAELGGSIAFGSVEAGSGPYRAAMRAQLTRMRPPAAVTAYVDENTATDAPVGKRGPRFGVYVAARSLRTVGGPRQDESDSLGSYSLISVVRGALDGVVIVTGRRAVAAGMRYADGDDRLDIHELMYRMAPLAPVPLFDGAAIGGRDAVTTRELGPPEGPARLTLTRTESGTYEVRDGPEMATWDPGTTLVWEGEIRGESDADIADVMDGLHGLASVGTEATLEVPDVLSIPDITVKEVRLLRPMGQEMATSTWVQPVRVVFQMKE